MLADHPHIGGSEIRRGRPRLLQSRSVPTFTRSWADMVFGILRQNGSYADLRLSQKSRLN
jgi:hypothetical protein